MWAAFVSAVSHPRATQINSVRCCTAMLTHSEDTSVKYTTSGKPSEALGLENPTLPSPSQAQLPPLLWWKERKHLYYSPLLFIYLQNYTLLFLDHVPMCFVMFPFKQNIYACGLGPCLANTCTRSCTQTPIQLSPCARGPLCPSPHL